MTSPWTLRPLRCGSSIAWHAKLDPEIADSPRELQIPEVVLLESLRNRGSTTIDFVLDDEDGDSGNTGATVTYSPSSLWFQGSGCDECFTNLDPSQTKKGTWHELVQPFEDLSRPYIEVHVYNAILSGIPTELEFTLDGEQVGTYSSGTDSSGSDLIQYYALVHKSVGLDNVDHTLIIQPPPGVESLVLFDFVRYTFVAEIASIQPPSLWSSPISTTSPASSSVTRSINSVTHTTVEPPNSTTSSVSTSSTTISSSSSPSTVSSSTTLFTVISSTLGGTTINTAISSNNLTTTDPNTAAGTGTSAPDSGAFLSSHMGIIAGGALGGAVLIIFLAIVIFLIRRRKRKRTPSSVRGSRPGADHAHTAQMRPGFPQLSYSTAFASSDATMVKDLCEGGCEGEGEGGDVLAIGREDYSNSDSPTKSPATGSPGAGTPTPRLSLAFSDVSSFRYAESVDMGTAAASSRVLSRSSWRPGERTSFFDAVLNVVNPPKPKPRPLPQPPRDLVRQGSDRRGDRAVSGEPAAARSSEQTEMPRMVRTRPLPQPS
ncbi:hypothetical protein C8Q80DRAFT_1277673 [Daedaleopsis nitida]|nr:hypothetical protein C8Q80DRAFT_1277673 [Daedaleopsis nitida]